jgi:hypothetical protein
MRTACHEGLVCCSSLCPANACALHTAGSCTSCTGVTQGAHHAASHSWLLPTFPLPSPPLQDMSQAFPAQSTIPTAHFHAFQAAVARVLHISDEQRRQVIVAMKKARPAKPLRQATITRRAASGQVPDDSSAGVGSLGGRTRLGLLRGDSMGAQSLAGEEQQALLGSAGQHGSDWGGSQGGYAGSAGGEGAPTPPASCGSPFSPHSPGPAARAGAGAGDVEHGISAPSSGQPERSTVAPAGMDAAAAAVLSPTHRRPPVAPRRWPVATAATAAAALASHATQACMSPPRGMLPATPGLLPPPHISTGHATTSQAGVLPHAPAASSNTAGAAGAAGPSTGTTSATGQDTELQEEPLDLLFRHTGADREAGSRSPQRAAVQQYNPAGSSSMRSRAAESGMFSQAGGMSLRSRAGDVGYYEGEELLALFPATAEGYVSQVGGWGGRRGGAGGVQQKCPAHA